MEVESFKTLAKPSEEVLYKERKSKFFGYAYPVSKEDEVKGLIEAVRKKHPSSNHVCYAWQMGIGTPTYRANDDGEPKNSAGMPIYGQIQSFGVTNTLVAVARIFGGTKLGVGGLIQSYREAAKLALENSEIIEKLVEINLEISFGYEDMNKVMSLLKRFDAKIANQKLELDCKIEVKIPKAIERNFLIAFEAHHKILVKIKN